MNITATDIVNAALRLVGARTLVNLDDPADRSLEAAQARFFWPLVRQTVFEAHPWKCLARQASLTLEAPAPSFGFDHAYVLPADWVRMIRMEPDDGRYTVFGSLLHTSYSPAEIEYVHLQTDCTKYTGSLVRCLYLNLAYELAYALPHDPDLADRLRVDLEKFFLPVAKMADAVGRGVRSPASDILTDLFR